MTDAEALELVREWWLKGTALLNSTPDRGFRPKLEPTLYGWGCWLVGINAPFNVFSGGTLAEAVERARETVEKELARAD